MPDTAGQTPILAVKKMGGIFLIILGLLLTAWGFSYGYTWLGILGVLVLVGGGVVLALKVIRRNPPCRSSGILRRRRHLPVSAPSLNPPSRYTLPSVGRASEEFDEGVHGG